MFLCYFQFNKGSKVENKVVKVVVFSVRWPYCLIWLLARNTAAKLGLWNNLTLWNLALMCTESKIIAGYEFKCSFQECCVSSGPTLPYLFECKFKLLWLYMQPGLSDYPFPLTWAQKWSRLRSELPQKSPAVSQTHCSRVMRQNDGFTGRWKRQRMSKDFFHFGLIAYIRDSLFPGGGGSASKFSLKNEQANILITQNKMLVFFFHLILHMTEWFRLICQNPIWIWAVVLRYQSKPFIFISLLYMHHDGSGRKIDKRSTSDKKQLVI